MDFPEDDLKQALKLEREVIKKQEKRESEKLYRKCYHRQSTQPHSLLQHQKNIIKKG